MDATAEKQARRKALRRFVERCTVPVVATRRSDGVKAVEGSGLLYRAGGRHFFVTATHVARMCISGEVELGLPAQADVAEPINAAIHDDEGPDVAVLRLPDAYIDAIERSGQWTFVDGDEERDVPLDPNSHFVLFGYPAMLNKVVGTTVTGALQAVYTRVYEGDAEGVGMASTPREWDLVLAMPDADADLFHSMSGCGVWEDRESQVRDPGALWTVERAFRPVAVQTAIHRQKRWIRTTTWAVVHGLIARCS